MNNKKIINLSLFLLIWIFLSSFLAAISISSGAQGGLSVSLELEEDVGTCQDTGQDLVIHIPFSGCSPNVVRSDLLEENNVPVYCKLSAISLNPLIDIESIESISFSGSYSPEVAGIKFSPAKAALSSKSSSLENAGYLLIYLKKQPNASAMPEFVSGNLTAKVKYNLKNELGVGNVVYYLREFKDELDWEENKYKFSFWNNKGYLRLEEVSGNSARISVYVENRKISSVNLKKGETSQAIYLPGFECKTGLKIKLNDFEDPSIKARLKINSEIIELGLNEKFLDNKCIVTSISQDNIREQVGIKCSEDSGVKSSVLTISPKIKLKIGEEEREVEIGDFLYEESSDGKSNFVYLIGVSSKRQEGEDKLTAWFASIPSSKRTNKNNLVSSELSSFSLIINELLQKGNLEDSPTTITDSLISAFRSLKAKITRLIGSVNNRIISIPASSQHTPFFGKSLYFEGFASPENEEISDESLLKNYESAVKDYELIQTSYSSEETSEGHTYGEEALYQEIILAYSSNQKLDAQKLCSQFFELYPLSTKDLQDFCSEKLISGQSQNAYFPLINGELRKISLSEVYEPSFKDYGARLIIDFPEESIEFDLIKDKLNYFRNKDEFVKLVSTDYTKSKIKINIKDDDLMEKIKKEFGSDTITLEKDNPKTIGDYVFTINEINLIKSAKVGIISSIADSGTQANFSFKIGIEQRAFKLSPEQAKSSIEKLDKEIEVWKGISDNLETLNEGLKTACITTGVALIVKNFIAGTGTEGTARALVMKAGGGWYEKCSKEENFESCLNENSDLIDKDVETLSELMREQNSDIKELQDKHVISKDLIGGKEIDTLNFVGEYSQKAATEINNLNPTIIEGLEKEGIDLDVVTKVLNKGGYEKKQFTIEQIRNIELYSNILKSEDASSNLTLIAKKQLTSVLNDISINSKVYTQQVEAGKAVSISSDSVSVLKIGGEKTKELSYEGLTLGDITSSSLEGNDPNSPVAYVLTTTSKKYLVILDNSAKTNTLPIKRTDRGLEIYEQEENNWILAKDIPEEFNSVFFSKGVNYNNGYKNAKVRYYETAPYKGMPAIVPFNLQKGWYAATKQTLATLGSAATYDDSGRISIFYLCNVGENGLEEFQATSSDDKCQRIDLGVSQTYDSFAGLTSSETSSLITKAVNAIEQAAKAYKPGLSGKIKILDSLVEVGSPAVDGSEFRCQDFMSPKECLFLFNLCDPVICPSSRCDFGGKYPVKDVVQSGIIGSLALCLPNAKEGVIIPVCLTGVKAGIDSFVSVKQSYRDCLNESLETGKMVGICDEIYSFYICDFFWRQASPLTQLIIPKVFEAILGQNVKGGGEYLNVANSWSMTEQAIDYFINSYGVNSKKAFNARTSEGIGGELCKAYSSSVVGEEISLFDSLIKSDSPAQFTGRFDEIPMTSATVPPKSQYKVYYNIYSGTDAGAYYKVYLRGTKGGSYYQDTDSSVLVSSGYVAVGSYASDTKDIITNSGYTELCISVNGDEECGFKEASTSFAVNYFSDKIVESQAKNTTITSESQCSAGLSQGIIRTCATENPGKGTDSYVETTDSKWQDVGYCGNANMRCWIDTDSVKDSIRLLSTEQSTLEEISQDYLEKVNEEQEFIDKDGFYLALQQIKSEPEIDKKMKALDSLIEEVILNEEKAELLLLRANLVGSFFLEDYLRGYLYCDYCGEWSECNSDKMMTRECSNNNCPTTSPCPQDLEGEDCIRNIECEEWSECIGTKKERTCEDLNKCIEKPFVETRSCDPNEIVLEDFSELEMRNKILKEVESFIGESSADFPNPVDSVLEIYANAGFSEKCVYSDPPNKIYNFKNKHTFDKTQTLSTSLPLKNQEDTLQKWALSKLWVYKNCETVSTIGDETTSESKLDNLKKGDLIYYIWSESKGGNSAIFINWVVTDKIKEEDRIANLFDGDYFGRKIFRYTTENLSDNSNGVYVYFEPIEKAS